MSKGTGQNNKAAELRMSLVEHLGEFRKRLVIVVICFLVSSILVLTKVEWFVDILIQKAEGFQFVYIAPAELVTSYFKLSLTGGIILTSPIILYELWAFVRPGLKRQEKRVGLMALLFGLVLFVLGSTFAYTVAMPFMLRFFMNINASQVIKPMISFQSYMNFVTSTLLTFGIVFEMPVVTILLTQLGILKPHVLVKSRKVVILLIFIIAAIITPPDVISQIVVAVPMLILFEMSVLVCKVLFRKKLQRAPEEDLALL